MTASRTVSISCATGAPPLSPGQKKFNDLIAKIETQRKLLAEWQAAIPLYRQRHASEVMPLLAAYQALHVELAHLLDQRVDLKSFSRADRDTLRETVRDIAVQLMHGEHEGAMRALYNRNSDADFETDQLRARKALQAMVEEEFGVRLGDDLDLDSPEALFLKLQSELRAHSNAQPAGEPDEPGESATQRRRAKPSAKQLKAEAEASQASQSVREVYRKLASELHPDRETDPAERARKTALMQQVNQAYAAKDLLTLLQLQLDIEQITPQAIHGMAEGRLKHYIKVLTTQLAELQAEVGEQEHSVRHLFNLDAGERLGPAQLPKLLARHKQMLQYDSAQLQRQLRELKDDAALKHWLKQRRQSARQGVEDALFEGLVRQFG